MVAARGSSPRDLVVFLVIMASLTLSEAFLPLDPRPSVLRESKQWLTSLDDNKTKNPRIPLLPLKHSPQERQQDAIIERVIVGASILLWTIAVWGLVILFLFDLVLYNFPSHLYLRIY